MKLIKMISCTVIIGVVLALAHNALAFPDFLWTDQSGDNQWTTPVNWTNLDGDTNGLPENGLSGAAVQIDPANGSTSCVLPAGYVADLDYENPTTYFNTVYGPEFGEHLNIYGTLEYGWMMAPVQNDPTPANRTIVNLYTNSVLQTQGAGIGIGDGWWFYWGGPYATLNMYANAALNTPNIAVGGHLNMYDTATANVTGAIFTTANNCLSDGTASFNMGGGTLNLPTGWTNEAVQPNNDVYDLIQRGVLRAYGKGQDTNDFNIIDNGVNTIVTPVPLGGALQQVYFQPLLQANVTVGTFQQLTLVGDYPAVTGVLLSSSEPGVDPASFAAPVYSSSNPNVATIDANGIVTAVGLGTAQLSATVGALHSVNTLALTVAPVAPNLIHRYSFSAASGSDAPDSIGGADGTLTGGYSLGNGQVTFDGSSGYVELPAGILTGLNQVTIETWASFGPSINVWACLFACGNSDANGAGENYITMQPHTGGTTAQIGFGQGDPGNNGERDAFFNGTLDGQTNMHVVVVFNPLAGSQTLYTNGVLAATVSMFNTMIDPVAYNGPLFAHQTILPFTLTDDELNYIGHSLYSADPTLNGSITEFRIYSTPLTPSQIAADYALGPNQVIGTSTGPVALAVSRSGNKVVFSWPTTSAAVTLLTSPVLGPNAVWTPINLPSGAMTVSNGNYQVTMPASAAVQFFRLSN